MVTGAFKNSPTVALESLLNLVPLHIEIQKETIIFAYSCWNNDNATLRSVVGPQILTLLKSAGEILDSPNDFATAIFIFEKHFKIHYPLREDWAGGNIVFNDDVLWFTDGSKNNDGVGFGAF